MATSKTLLKPREERAERARRAPAVRRLEEHRAERRARDSALNAEMRTGDRDRQRELLVEAARQAAEEGDRDEHGGQDQRDADDGPDTSSIALIGGLARLHAVLDVVHHRLDDHDRVVDDDADGEHQAEHRERVHAEAEQREEDERAEERDRDREQRDDRRAHVLQEHEHDEDDEDQRLDERVLISSIDSVDRGRRVVDDLVVHVVGKSCFELLERARRCPRRTASWLAPGSR